MRVCDVCKKPITNFNKRVEIKVGLISYNYEVCRKCAMKTVRCIKYMKLMNEKRGVN